MVTLKSKAEFDFVYKYGFRQHCKILSLYTIDIPHFKTENKVFTYKERKALSLFSAVREDYLIGLSVSKKNGNAPQRNKIKRRLRAFCRNHQKDLQSHILLFVARDGILDCTYSALEEEIWKMLNKRRKSV
ncbi:ribonuclease P protein component [Helicobacter enhydrae]|uniref:Ribonuclease P protein component n=2 Tax=Helicobacter enhydrae TaxID=222136 RepID=A0A1B1U4C0_9HELI|nr:ribonuclease P protein component [Helicobacter enhydrae]